MSNTLGTALGDYVSDASGFGYDGSAVIFGAALIFLTLIYRYPPIDITGSMDFHIAGVVVKILRNL